jgi:hypothetical protein
MTILGGAGLLLAGCSSMSGPNLARETLALVGQGRGADYPRTRAEIDALPYAQLGFAQGEGPRAVFVLAHAQGEELSWVSANRVQIVTVRNRIVRTTGLRSDLGRTEIGHADLWDLYSPDQGRVREGELHWRVQFEPGREAPVAMRSRFVVEGEESLDILGERIDTLRVREDVDVAQWRWQASNRWWLSRQSALAWRSVQHLVPDQPPLVLEVLKRPA